MNTVQGKRTNKWLTVLCLIAACGCGGGSSGGGGGGNTGPVLPATYSYDSKFTPGTESVNYTGQTYRHLLINEVVSILEGLTNDIDTNAFNPNDGDTYNLLNAIYEYDNTVFVGKAHTTTTTPSATPTTYDAVSSSNKSLVEKTAGNDAVTDHKVWTTPGNFVGWSDTSIEGVVANGSGADIRTPEGFIRALMNLIDRLARDRENGTIPTEPGTATPVSQVYLTGDGLDLRQLLQKFLLMAIPYSQGTDDYLDDDVAGKGLLALMSQDGANPYSRAEHQWDEGWGYFGAARNYGDYTDNEIAGASGRADFMKGYNDANGDNMIDLRSEFNFGQAVNAAKRDRGSNSFTNFTQEAFDGFRRGRQILNESAGGTMDSASFTELQSNRNQAVLAWEKAIAATVVHYINDVLQDMGKFNGAIAGSPYSYTDHCKHWAEMKGFALGLQFNPRKQISDMDFSMFHTLVGDRPVLETATAMQVSTYKANLLAARDLLQNAYSFDAANMGDNDGNNGW